MADGGHGPEHLDAKARADALPTIAEDGATSEGVEDGRSGGLSPQRSGTSKEGGESAGGMLRAVASALSGSPTPERHGKNTDADVDGDMNMSMENAFTIVNVNAD